MDIHKSVLVAGDVAMTACGLPLAASVPSFYSEDDAKVTCDGCKPRQPKRAYTRRAKQDEGEATEGEAMDEAA